MLASGTVKLINTIIELERPVYGLDEFDEDDSTGTVFRDAILLALIGFVAIVIMLLPHIKPTQEDDEDHRAPGNLIVQMH